MTAQVIKVNFRAIPSSRCTPFSLARARLESLRPCLGTAEHEAAFCEMVAAAVIQFGKGARVIEFPAPQARAGE